MPYVAFDVSGQIADGVITTRTLTIRKRFRVVNTTAAIRALLAPLRQRYRRLIVGVESTNLCHRPVVEACTELNITCRLINPVLTKEVIAHSIRKRKTDRDDAFVIAQLLAQGEGRPVTTVEVVNPTKTITRSACKIGQMARRLTVHRRHVAQICGATPALEKLAGQVEVAQRELRQQAIAQAEPVAARLCHSLPGIGPWLTAVILAEIGDVHRFDSADALVAYAGLDPRVIQSGPRLTSGRLTKRGSPHLRWALVCAANIARRYDPEMIAYFQKKRGQGRPYTVALCATAKKLTYRLYAVLKRGTPYEKREGVVVG